VPERGHLAYRLALDEYQGQQRVQMIVEAMSEQAARPANLLQA
jgi:single-stranded-DNA-specific exonuclease